LPGRWGALSAIVVATAAWSFTALAGISPVVVGVALGLVTSSSRVEAVEKRLHPWVAMLVLPLFAFFASGVSLAGGLVITSAMTIAILARPLGKIIGINFGAALARILVKNSGFDDLRPAQIARISTLGGIGFTVALLISNQIFGAGSELANQAIIATLVAMVVSMVVGAVALSWRRT
jgi:NhaA family Na+:H+ antiporter